MTVLERRPILLVLAGPNGAGKSTFYDAHFSSLALPFVNADELAMDLELDAYTATEAADRIRRELFARRESFVFETVFSDPVGAKLEFMKEAERSGYTVVLFFIGIDNAETSEDRVAMRVAQGGHDVPKDKLRSRYPRITANLERALVQLSNVRAYDNSDLRSPNRPVAVINEGVLTVYPPIPKWLKPLLPPHRDFSI
jgi:predicted ABC-type ATPase